MATKIKSIWGLWEEPTNSKAGNNSPLFGSLVRHDECNKLCHFPSPIVLSSPTDDATQHPQCYEAQVILPKG